MRRARRSSRPDTLFPYAALFRSLSVRQRVEPAVEQRGAARPGAVDAIAGLLGRAIGAGGVARIETLEIRRAHVCTPVTNAHLVCRLLLDKKENNIIPGRYEIAFSQLSASINAYHLIYHRHT